MTDRQPPRRVAGGDRQRQFNTWPTIGELIAAAVGRCVEILIAAGLPAESLAGRHGRPCVKCGGRDRFTPLPDVARRGAVHCRWCFTAGMDPKPGDIIATLRWWMDCDVATACRWLQDYLCPGGKRPDRFDRRRPTVAEEPQRRTPDCDRMTKLADGYAAAVDAATLQTIADHLPGVAADAVARLSVGWWAGRGVTTWPMRSHTGAVVGIRTRDLSSGNKSSVAGSVAGLFIAAGLIRPDVRPGRLFITEGPTDAAALLSAGLFAVGRDAARSTETMADAARYAGRMRPAEVVIVADGDEPGRVGAHRSAVPMLAMVPAVRIITPPPGVKDVRAWVAGGATAADIEAAADAAEARSLTRGTGR